MVGVSFDRAVKYYDSTRGYPPKVAERIRDAIIQYTHTGDTAKFIELGIGTGLIGIPFIEASHNYVGVDLSIPMMIEIPKKLSKNIKTEQVQLAQVDITKSLPFCDNSFDVVIAVRVFHLLANWKSAIAEAKRVLKQGSIMLIARDASTTETKPINPMVVVHSKWDEILADLGIVPGSIRPGLWLSDETIVDYLHSQSAHTQVVDLVKYNSRPLSIRMMAERHQQRMYSRDWELSEDTHTEAVKRLMDWLDYECNEPDTAVTQRMTFRAIIAFWDS